MLVAAVFCLPTAEQSYAKGDLQGMSQSRSDTCKHIPIARWNMDSIDTRRFTSDARLRSRYGSFVQSDMTMFDTVMFRMSPAEAGPLEAQ